MDRFDVLTDDDRRLDVARGDVLGGAPDDTLQSIVSHRAPGRRRRASATVAAEVAHGPGDSAAEPAVRADGAAVIVRMPAAAGRAP